MVVYEEATQYSPVRDSAWVSKEFQEQGVKIARLLSQMSDIQGRLEYLRDLTKDNGDPAFESHEAVEALGKVLAVCINYAEEYEVEAKGEEAKSDEA